MNKMLKFGIVLVVGMLLPVLSSAYVYPGYYWHSGQAGYDYYGVPASWWDAINAAADTWSNAGADFEFSWEIWSEDSIILYDLSGGIVALTTVWRSGNSINRVRTKIDTSGREWSTWGESGKYDVQNVMTHEFGHWLTLGDITCQDSVDTDDLYTEVTMYIYFEPRETKKRSLEEDDKLGIRSIYGETGVEEYYIQVNSPNGGEVWYYDETHNITWNTGTLAETPADSVVIHYSTDGGSTYPYRIAKVINTSGDFPWYGSYSWTIPRNPSTSCKVRVTGYFQSDPYSHGDVSDDNFTIKNPLYLSGWMEWINPPKSPKSQVEPMDVNHYRAHLYWTFNASYTPYRYGLYRKLKYPLPGDPTGWVRIYYGSNKSYVDPYDFQLGSGAWYYVRAYITGVPYIQSNTIYLAPDIQTSSFIYVWDGKEFVEDNNILAGSGNEEIEEYWYKLREGPVEESNIYRLQIREESNEYSFFDRVRLIAIDHPDSIEIFVRPDGDIVPVSSMIASQSVMRENEVNYTSNLLNNDNIYVKANEVDKITGVLPLTVSSDDESLRFIFIDGSQILDHIRFVTRNNAPYHIKPCPLVYAAHSDIGSVKQKLLVDDEEYVELLPGDTITLEFEVVGMEPGWVRDFVFVSNGYYITEGEGEAQTAYSNIPMVHSLSLYPNPARNDMTIRFDIPSEERVSLKVYDVSGREVKRLVDDRFEAGYHIIRLDSKNLPSGIYFARLVTNNYEATKKLVLMK